MISVGGGYAGEDRDLLVKAPFNYRGAEAGGHDVAGASVDGLLRLGDGEDRACAQKDVGELTGYVAYGGGGGPGAEGYLGYGHVARDQRFGQRYGMGRVVDLDYGHDADAAQPLQNFLHAGSSYSDGLVKSDYLKRKDR